MKRAVSSRSSLCCSASRATRSLSPLLRSNSRFIEGMSANTTPPKMKYATSDPKLASAIRRGGRLVHPNGIEPAPRKRRGVRVIAYDAVAGPREFQQLDRAVEAAKLKVVIAAAHPLAQARRAHERLAKRHVLGKIVLKIR